MQELFSLGFTVAQVNKFVGVLGEEEILRLMALDSSSQEKVVGELSMFIHQEKTKMQATEEYKKAKEDLAVLNEAFKDATMTEDVTRKLLLKLGEE